MTKAPRAPEVAEDRMHPTLPRSALWTVADLLADEVTRTLAALRRCEPPRGQKHSMVDPGRSNYRSCRIEDIGCTHAYALIRMLAHYLGADRGPDEKRFGRSQRHRERGRKVSSNQGAHGLRKPRASASFAWQAGPRAGER